MPRTIFLISHLQSQPLQLIVSISSLINTLVKAIVSLGIFVLRTYAIYDRNWLVFVILTIPGLGIVASSIVCFDIYDSLFFTDEISFPVGNYN